MRAAFFKPAAMPLINSNSTLFLRFFTPAPIGFVFSTPNQTRIPCTILHKSLKSGPEQTNLLNASFMSINTLNQNRLPDATRPDSRPVNLLYESLIRTRKTCTIMHKLASFFIFRISRCRAAQPSADPRDPIRKTTYYLNPTWIDTIPSRILQLLK